MKLRAGRKGEGHAEREDLASLHAGLICLTGGEEGPLAGRVGKWRHFARNGMRAAIVRFVWT